MYEINFGMILGKKIMLNNDLSHDKQYFIHEQCTKTKDDVVKIMKMHHDVSHDMKNCAFCFIHKFTQS